MTAIHACDIHRRLCTIRNVWRLAYHSPRLPSTTEHTKTIAHIPRTDTSNHNGPERKALQNLRFQPQRLHKTLAPRPRACSWRRRTRLWTMLGSLAQPASRRKAAQRGRVPVLQVSHQRGRSHDSGSKGNDDSVMADSVPAPECRAFQLD